MFFMMGEKLSAFDSLVKRYALIQLAHNILYGALGVTMLGFI